MSWGNAEDGTNNRNMVSPAGYILEVSDVNDNEKVALKATNGDGADAVALQAVGKSKLEGEVKVGNSSGTGYLNSGGESGSPQILHIGASQYTTLQFDKSGGTPNFLDKIIRCGDPTA